MDLKNKALQHLKNVGTSTAADLGVEGHSFDPKLVLVALLQYVPTPKSCRTLCKDILAQHTAEALSELASDYITTVILPVYSQQQTPFPTPHSSPPPEFLDGDFGWGVSMSRTSQLHELVALREDYRCVVTGFVAEELEKLDRVRFHVLRNAGGGVGSMCQVAHILPFSLVHSPSDTAQDEFTKPLQHEAILRFCDETIVKHIVKAGINEPVNALFLEPSIRSLFGKLKLGFQEVGTNTYNVVRFYLLESEADGVTLNTEIMRQVTFTTGSYLGKPIPPPSPILLRVHFALCKVFHASGMANFMSWVEQSEICLKGVLAEDGSEADLLKASLGLARIAIVSQP